MSFKTHSVQIVGGEGQLIDVECHITNGLPTVVMVGMTNKSVDESRERLRAAFSSSGLQFPKKRVTINLAPADIQKLGSSFDVAIAAAILKSTGAISCPDTIAFFGELGLNGDVHPVRGMIGKLLAARAAGMHTMVIPVANIQQAQLVPGIELLAIHTLKDLHGHYTGSAPLELIATNQGVYQVPLDSVLCDVDITDVVGQERAKRALLIAAAGGHNVLLNGPPGMGKSMLAKTLPGIMPSLSHEEALQITHLHSLGGNDPQRVMYARPFRSPHHSASDASMLGGGGQPRPGEISLASGGVLFLDELPEFRRSTIESLRQPLEDGVITVSRAKESVVFPARFMLIATRNPCPCGYFGSTRECTCTASQIQAYNKKISGPIEDRIDIHITVDYIAHDRLLKKPTSSADSAELRALVEKARAIQTLRYKGFATNASATTVQIKSAALLEPSAEQLLNIAATRLHLSPRVYLKTLKIGRTIADLDASKIITAAHISEALQYRPIKTAF